jgi:hypothetical protein
MNELQFATGLDAGDDAVPASLRGEGPVYVDDDDDRPQRRQREDEIRYQ